jgi:hypothetical protein
VTAGFRRDATRRATLVSRASGAKRNETRDPARNVRSTISACCGTSFGSWVPARAREPTPCTKSTPRRALGRDTKVVRDDALLRTLGRDRARCRIIPIHHVKQRSLLRSQGALLRPGFAFSFPSTPDEGRAERRKAQYFCCRAVGRDRPCLARRGARPAGRARLSALHRGDFGPGAALPSPAFPPDQCSELLAARS